MAEQVTNYKCPACTGPLHYVGASGKLECDYCGSSYEVAEIEAMFAQEEQKAKEAHKEEKEQESKKEESWDASGISQEWGEDGAGMKTYHCPSCGAELLCDATTAATSCPYCGNPAVVPGQFTGGMKPDCVIPFKLDQKAAKAALLSYYKGKKFLPKSFVAGNKVQELKGIYVPFWLYDGVADAEADYHTTTSSVRRRGDYEITETRHYAVHRGGTIPFEKIPVDASSKMPDEYMDAIEPYQYADLKPFSNAYLPGFLADQYDVSLEESAERADERAANSAVSALRSDVTGYQTCLEQNHSVRLHRGKVQYALMPVYMLATKWEEKNYLFAMNGQTGKLIGNLPVDKKKYWAWFAGITSVLTLILGTIILAFS